MFLFRKPFVISFFIVLGLASEYMLWQVRDGLTAIVILAPVLSVVHFLETLIPALTSLSPLQHELAVTLPLILIYFGFTGYWLCQIGREEGFLKYVILFAFIGFLIVIHWQAFDYLESLMLQSTAIGELTNTGP